MADIGKAIRDWLSSKSEGNPIIPSKEKEEIRKLDEPVSAPTTTDLKEQSQAAQKSVEDQYESRVK